MYELKIIPNFIGQKYYCRTENKVYTKISVSRFTG